MVLELLENIEMIYDPETVKTALNSLKSVFQHADQIQKNLYQKDDTFYMDFSNMVDDIMHMMKVHDWDAKKLFENAANRNVNAHGIGFVTVEEMPLATPEKMKEEVASHLATLGIK